MANQVYANGREISCKAADGKSIAAFPDVCFTPPQTPATPPGVPIPYPNTGVSSDTSDGSKNVKISGKEIMMKDSSPFSKTSGNEAGNAPKKGVITSKNTGKAFFNSWSMDVKVEGSNVVRHLDLMTHNHGSKPGNTPPWPYTDEMTAAFGSGGVCDGMTHIKLKAYKEGCDGGKTPHHLIPGRCLRKKAGYSHRNAPCICVSGATQYQGAHERCHGVFDPVEFEHHAEGKPFTYETARETAVESAGQAKDPPSDLSEKEKKCLSFQLDQYYKSKPKRGPGCNSNTQLRTSGKRGKVLPASTIETGGA